MKYICLGYYEPAKHAGMTEDEVERLANAEDIRYPEIPKFYENLEKLQKKNQPILQILK